MRRLTIAVAIAVLTAGWAATPTPARASCAGSVTFEEIASEPGSAVFTGRATGELPGSYHIVFAVDRWFHGRHASGVVRLLDSTAYLVEPDAGAVQAALARVTAGDAVSLVRDEPVLMVATWTAATGVFAVRFCTVAGVPLDSPEGREAVRAAVALVGPDRAAAELPSTDTAGAGARDAETILVTVRDWWSSLVALALAAAFVLLARRTKGRIAAS